MPSDEIISNMEKKAEEQVSTIQKNCQNAVDTINRELNEAVNQVQEKWARKFHETMDSMDKTGKDESLMVYRNITMEKKSSIIHSAWDMVESVVKDLRKNAMYREIIEKSVKYAVSNLGNNCTVYGSGNDRELIASLGKGFTFSPDDKISGGIKAISKDGKLTLDMTIRGTLNERRDDFEEMLMGREGA